MSISQKELETAIRRGLGRAVLWLRRGEVVPDRDFLLYACTCNLAFDRQVENNRALYMLDVIQATGEPEYYARAVEQALAEVGESEDWADDERSISQMFDLLGLLASGDLAARQSLYPLFAQHAARSDAFGAEVLVDVDGLDGYLFVIRQWLQYPRDEEDYWLETSLLEDAEKRFGAEEVQAFLTQAALAEPAIGVYLAEVRQKQEAEKARRRQRPKPHKPSSAELRQTLLDFDNRFNRPQMWRWGEKMSDDDAKMFASELLAEDDPKRLERYLHLFHRRAFPLDHAPLLTLAQSSDEAITAAARAALAQIADPAIRTLALDLMDTDSRPDQLIEMLELSFQPGDEKAIERVLEKPWDADEMHWIGLDMRHVFERNTTPLATRALLLFYERGDCTFCRSRAVELLAKNGPLPPDIVEEGRYDADDETRKLVTANAER